MTRPGIPIFCLAALLASFVFAQPSDPPVPPPTGSQRFTIEIPEPLGALAEIQKRLGWSAMQMGEANYELAGESFEAQVPAIAPDSPPCGLLIWIPTGSMSRPPAAWKEPLEKRKLIWASSADLDRRPPARVMSVAIHLTRHLQQAYRIDADRIYVSGFGPGSSIASMAAVVFPDVFTGGAVYTMGSTGFKNLPITSNTFYPGFWTKPDEDLLKLASERRFAFLTGVQDPNKLVSRLCHELYTREGFRHAQFLEIPDPNHRGFPPTEWFDRALAFLDEPLVAQAKAKITTALNHEQKKEWRQALELYEQALSHALDLPLLAEARAHLPEVREKLREQGRAESEAILASHADSAQLRAFAETWKGESFTDPVREAAEKKGAVELETILKRLKPFPRAELQAFCNAWKGYEVGTKAMEIFEAEAANELKSILAVTVPQARTVRLGKFAQEFAPAPSTIQAMNELETEATAELGRILQIPGKSTRLSRLKTFVKIYAGTAAIDSADRQIQILELELKKR